MTAAALLTRRSDPAAKWTLFIQRLVGCSGRNAFLVAGRLGPVDRHSKASSDKSDLRSRSLPHAKRGACIVRTLQRRHVW